MAEPSTTILTRIHAAHPKAAVSRYEGEMWQAIIPEGQGERAIYRRSLAELEQRLDQLRVTPGAPGTR